MKLIDLQRRFRAHLLGPPGRPGSEFSGAGAAGLAVYHNAYRVQLVAMLRDVYAATHSWLGDDAFEAAARAYVADHPPHSWTLADYGFDLPATLADRYPDDPEVADLAWLDLSLRRAFDGPDMTPVSVDALAGVDWDRALLQLAPTLRWRVITSNCAAIWSAIARGDPPPPAARLAEPLALRVWRDGYAPTFRTIGLAEREALALVSGGADFATVCATFAARDPDGAAALCGSFLADWLRDGLVVAVRT